MMSKSQQRRLKVQGALLSFQDIMDNISNAMEEIPGEEVARIHNEICSRKVTYEEDSIWQYTGKDDNNPDPAKDEGEGMCDGCKKYTKQGKYVGKDYLCRECR